VAQSLGRGTCDIIVHMEQPRAIDEIKRVDEVFEDNAGKDAGRVLGDPANWSGSSGDEIHALGEEGTGQDPDAILAAQLLEKADEERRGRHEGHES